METGLPFVSLWCAESDPGKLHILSREADFSVTFPALEANHRDIEEFLPELAQAAHSPDARVRWLLLLEPSLPNAWQTLRWESLNFAGRPLSSQALVVRKAVWGLRQIGTDKTTARFLDLFPQFEFSFGSRLESLTRFGPLLTSRRAFLKKDMASAGDFFIMAHGRANGLVDAAGDSFDVPVAYPMPKRIWLLACNVDRAMDKLAQRLLEEGCPTVIAATSDLAADEMACLVEELFEDQNPLEECLPRLARADKVINHDGGLHALTIWGKVDIDRSPCAYWNRLTWEDKHGAWPRYPLDDETTREEFFEALAQAISEHAWPITRDWMLPSLLLRAETHDHPSMQALVVQLGGMESPLAIRALAAAARRVGHYPAMARYLSKGLALPDLTVNERADYLGALANLFIDLDLPTSAAVAIRRHGECNIDDLIDRDKPDFRRLDWMSRMEARQGRLHVALDHMTAKRKRKDFDNGRELAWQLYLAAWGSVAGQVPLDIADQFAGEILERLEVIPVSGIHQGNDTTSYFLRALAAHAWAANAPAPLQRMEAWLPVAKERLSDLDPGPWAYLVAYLHLAGRASLPSFERAISALERAHYYLEAADFIGLAGNAADRLELVRKFQQRRDNSIEELLPGAQALSTDYEREVMQRATREITEPLSAGMMARLGILPL